MFRSLKHDLAVKNLSYKLFRFSKLTLPMHGNYPVFGRSALRLVAYFISYKKLQMTFTWMDKVRNKYLKGIVHTKM